MSERWVESAYALLVDTFPRRFRSEYGESMKLVFRELLDDPEVSKADLLRRALGDARYATGGILLGALLGFPVLLIWYVVRSDVVPYDPAAAYWQILLLFLASGFVGRLRSGTVVGGLMAGFVAGAVSALVVPGEYWLFPPGLSRDWLGFVLSWAFAAAFVMAIVAAGAGVGVVLRYVMYLSASFHDVEDELHPRRQTVSFRHRAVRSVHAFVKTWRTPG